MADTEPEGFPPTAHDHAQHPRHQGRWKEYNGHARIAGSCGETWKFRLEVQDRLIQDVSFTTDGCGFTPACGCWFPRDMPAALGGPPGESWHCELSALHTLEAACADYPDQRNRPRDAAEHEVEREATIHRIDLGDGSNPIIGKRNIHTCG